MSNWPGKYVIGLTGNIATGKSVVRKMLEHLGAYGIDADALVHRATEQNAPGYQPVVNTFGQWILQPNGQVDRIKLGQLVFNDADALAQLEAILHPLVQQAVDVLIKRSTQPVVVIEAIKLLEGKLASACDSIWVVDAPISVQTARLMDKRKLTEKEAQQRIQSQNPQADKLAAADVIITNAGSFEEVWQQVSQAWHKEFSDETEKTVVAKQQTTKDGNFSVKRGRPRDSQIIAEIISRLSKVATTPDDIMAAFGEKAFLLLRLDNETVGVAGWQVENLVTRTTDIYINADIALEVGLKALVEEIEEASKSLQSEVSLLFLTKDFAQQEAIWKQLGYKVVTSEALTAQAWRDAAEETNLKDRVLLFKQLRADRILRPI
ncbi:MAG: dephospho-CoA kinase [Anaerolineales bacterium]|nr:dephospho-CoA kinase [Anaerolineales bacterium]